MVSLLAFGILSWWGGPRMLHSGRAWMAASYAQKAQKALRQKDWLKASENVAHARQWLVQHPPVMRAYADLLIATRGDDLSLLQVLRSLEAGGHATPTDRIHIARILISLGHADAARAVFQKLTPEERQHHESLELEASLLTAEGRVEEAARLMRRALALAPDTPALRLKLAMLDYQGGFAEVRARASEQLWDLAAIPGDIGFQAQEFLAQKTPLTGAEADRLLALVERNPASPPGLRYTALSARLKAHPYDRNSLLQAEADRIRGQGVERLLPALNWFLQENSPQTVLDLLPDDLAYKSPALLHSYLLALSNQNRWQDIDRLLTGSRNLPVSQTFLHLWKARTADRLDQGIQTVRHHLEAAFAQTTGGQEESAAQLTATTAEEMNQWDLAARFYRDIAGLHPLSRSAMLEKVYAMALRGRDTDTALTATRELAALHPDNRIFSQRFTYLQLLAGLDLEGLQQNLTRTEDPEKTATNALLKALAAYRLRDAAAIRQHLTDLSPATTSTDFPPGLKAIFAGLLATTGQTAEAFRLAETIPAPLLLPEELRFLKRAL